MVVEPTAETEALRAAALERLIAAEGIGRHALFFEVGEGTVFPDGTEDESGYVLDEQARVFFFWTAWDPEQGQAVFDQWEQVQPEREWDRIGEYRRAWESIGLPA